MARLAGTAPEPAKKRLKSKETIERQAEKVRGPLADDDQHYLEQRASQGPKVPKAMKRAGMDEAGRNLRVQGEVADGKIKETDEEVEKKIAFCCHVCHCAPEIKAKYGDDQNVLPSEKGLYHRRCCHRTVEGPIPENWTPEVGLAYEAFEKVLTEHLQCASITYTPNKDLTDQRDELGKALTISIHGEDSIAQVECRIPYDKYKTNRKQENEMRRLDAEPLLADKLRSDERTGYPFIEKEFHAHVLKSSFEAKRGAKVVDLFGGIGAGILCLKRLGIKIDLVIHVEHCMVANVVYKHAHCQADDPTIARHVFLRTFEAFEKKLQDDKFMKKYGPFDIVIAGPPCVDYTLINANREGATGLQGSYLPRTGHVLRRIREYNDKVSHPYPFFIVENVILTDEEDRKSVKRAFGHDAVWLTKDSKDLSPLRRNRTYLSNIPLLAEEKLIDPPPRLCFEDGFDVAGGIFDPSLRHVKAPGLMASKGRLDDDPRMLIFKEDPEGSLQRYLYFLARTPNVSEREKLMGFPLGYVSEPLRELFEKVKYGLGVGLFDNEHWKTNIPEKYHAFAGDYHRFKGHHRPYQFYVKTMDAVTTEWFVKMAPPLAKAGETDSSENSDSRKPEYYTEEEFAKRLLGNSFSIPTVEWLLQPLVKLFDCEDYGEKFNYHFAWASWKESDDCNIQASRRVREYLAENDDSSSDEDAENVAGKDRAPNAAAVAKSRQQAGRTPPKPSLEIMERVHQCMLGVVESQGSDSDDDAADV